MSAGTITDPDLVQAIDELRFDVMRLERIEQQILEVDAANQYGELARMRFERGDLRETIRKRAERLNMGARTLHLLVEQANRMRTAKKHQVPALGALLNAVRIVADTTERDRIEAAADIKLAIIAEQILARRAAASAEAITYLEASR